VGRLYEQAALSYCLAARGPFNSIRQAEVLLSSIGVARERLTSSTQTGSMVADPASG
jgi:hypothetical protein